MYELKLPLGTILISYNKDDSLNHHAFGSKYNHLGIYIGKNKVIESQENQGVIISNLEDYIQRPYVLGLIYPRQKEWGINAAEKAQLLVGIKYRKISSLFKRPRKDSRGMNCCSLIRASYSYALGRDILIRIPDDILKFSDVFTNKLSEVK